MAKLQFVEKSNESVAERKKLLRAYMKKRRAENENRDVKEDLLVENFFTVLERTREMRTAGTRLCVFTYLSFSVEAGTDKLIQRLLESGDKVLCPRVEGKEMLAIEWGEDFSLSAFGIREPMGTPFDGNIDLIVTPLLAADRQGNRLGYGRGYYDTFFKKHPDAIRVGYCYDFQIVNEVPTEAWDEKLDGIVTNQEIIYVK